MEEARPIYPDTMTIRPEPSRQQAGNKRKLFDSNCSKVLGEESKTLFFDASAAPYDSHSFRGVPVHLAKWLRGIAQILRIVKHKIVIYKYVRSGRQFVLFSQDVVIDWERQEAFQS